MKKIGTVFFVFIFLLVGCSNEEKKTIVTDDLNFEEQIHNVMAENDLNNIEVIDYDIIQDFVYIIYKQKSEYSNTHYPALVILKREDSQWGWEAGPDDRTLSIAGENVDATIFERENGPSVTIMQPNDSLAGLKGIKVLGTYARKVTYSFDAMNDFTRQKSYWISYTDVAPKKMEDFEFIME